MRLTFGIIGRIPSKKNNKRILRRRGGGQFVGNSQDYDDWHEENIGQLICSYGGAMSGKCVNVIIEFTVGDRRAFDLTNKAESIMDLMVDAGVIDDDNYNVVPSVTLKYAGYEKGKWYALVTLQDAS